MLRWLVILLLLLPFCADAQSVPNGGAITPGQVWTPQQWTDAWQSKLDASGGVSANGTFNNPTTTNGTFNNPTINGGTLNGIALTGNASASTATSSNSITARTLANRFATVLNIKDFGAVEDGTTDDSAAWTATVNRWNALYASGTRAVIYVPGGAGTVIKTAPPIFNGPAALVGDSQHQSYIIVDPGLSGRVLAWDEAWANASYSSSSNTLVVSTDQAGPVIKNLTFIGSRAAASDQFPVTFYDREDFAHVENVDFFYFKGSAFRTGVLNTKSQSYMRESKFYNVEVWYCGDGTTAAVDLNSQGGVGTDANNTNSFYGLSILGPFGKGLWIRNNGSGTVRLMDFYGLRIEGATLSVSPTDDLLTIGDPSGTGLVRDLSMYGPRFAAGYTSFATIRFTAPSLVLAPTNIMIDGRIENGSGDGVDVDAGTNLSLSFNTLSVSGTSIKVASSATVGNRIWVNGYGSEQGWTYNIDSTSQNFVSFPSVRRTGTLGTAGGVVATSHDGTAAGGNAIGVAAVDLQTQRSANSQVASGQYSGVLSGRFQTINGAGTGAGLTNGQNGVLNGNFSRGGGNSPADHGDNGCDVFAATTFTVPGDAQSFRCHLSGSTSSNIPFVLSSDRGAAGATNVFNLPDNFRASFSIMVHVTDITTAGSDISWYMPQAMLTRDTGAASTALAQQTATTLTRGSALSGTTIVATADTTNGGIAITVTPPISNSDGIHVQAVLAGVEVK